MRAKGLVLIPLACLSLFGAIFGIVTLTRRGLYSSEVATASNAAINFEDPVLIPLGNFNLDKYGRTTYLQKAYQHIFNGLSTHSSNFVVYPYSVEHVDAVKGQTYTFPDGVVVRTTQDGLPDPYEKSYYFQYLYAEHIELYKAKALYESSIAVLKIRADLHGRMSDLTFESDHYCQALHVYLGRYANCFTWEGYQTYKNSSAKTEETSFVFLDEAAIREGALMAGPHSPRFGLLIIPDVISSADELIMDLLGSAGKAAIQTFVNEGGNVYASGKASSIVEGLGLVAEGVVSEESLIVGEENGYYVGGCGDGTMPPDRGFASEFFQRLMCLGQLRDKQSRIPGYILSAHPLDLGADPALVALLWFDMAQSSLFLKDAATGLSAPISREAPPLPLFAWKPYGKGRVMLSQGHPTSSSDKFYPTLYNAVFMAFSRPVIVDAIARHNMASEWVSETTFPALEADIVFEMTYEVRNLYDKPITDVVMTIDTSWGFDALIWDPRCQQTMHDLNPEEDHPTARYVCKMGTVAPLTTGKYTFQMNITQATATRRGEMIVVANASIVYTAGEPAGMVFSYSCGDLHISSHVAAVLRGDYNVDPVCFYPFFGEGYVLDSVVHAANREHTAALETEHIAIVPLAGPLVDGSDGDRIATYLDFYWQYYKKEVNGIADYVYPFLGKDSEREVDYIDYKLLSKRGASLNAEWDEPVKTNVVPREASFFPNVTDYSLDVGSVLNAAQTADPASTEDALRQREFTRADLYFEHGQQRMLVYVDTTTEAGAAAYYRDSSGAVTIPADRRNPNVDVPVAKTQIALARSDIYFSQTWPYPIPQGLKNVSVLTIDRFSNPHCTPGASSDHWGLGANAEVAVPGYFDSKQPGGIEPRRFTNHALADCVHTGEVLFYGDLEKRSGGQVRGTHYLMPFMGSMAKITRASDLMYFDGGVERNEYRGYPEIKFVRAHYAEFELSPDVSRNGGMLAFELPARIAFKPTIADPIAADLVGFAADQVAFYKMVWDAPTRTIRCWFRRGLMPNERYGKASKLLMTIENLHALQGSLPEDLNVTMRLWEQFYDFTSPTLERYSPRTPVPLTLTLHTGSFLSLPAARLSFRLDRPHSRFNAYENLAPFIRFHTLYQEIEHRPVYGLVESHHIAAPGMVSSSGGFSMVGTVGINPVPFREYLTTGISQFRPIASTTSYLSWEDVWGRRWIQPLRSALADVPPIPAPVRNFMLTSTFELLDPETGKRQMGWVSDRPVDVHLHMKVLNNYPKYYDATICKENEKQVLKAKMHGIKYGIHIFRNFSADDPMYLINGTAPNPFFWDVSLGKYGACYEDEGTILQGEVLTAEQRALIHELALCDYDSELNACPEVPDDFPYLRARPSDVPAGTVWNRSPAVRRYYPEGYFNDEKMEALVVSGYADTAYDKGHPWHMDNLLPNVDNGILKPHNIIAAPLWKGFGFVAEYDPGHTNPALPGRHGWWSDNLQNKDETLLGGQEVSQPIAVTEPDLPDSAWVDVENLEQADGVVAGRLRNIYVCRFNRYRLRHGLDNKRFTYHPNIVRNNVVPIPPSVTSKDLTQYECRQEDYYAPNEIASFDNRVVTNSARDWLYFGANLRGGAKESLHVMTTITPYPDVAVEGNIKVNDGARFVYWNPCCGPNTFLVVDDIVSVVLARRNDITLATELIPDHTTIFDAEFYQVVTLKDAPERYRQWREDPYLNHYGYGDVQISVYFGEDNTHSKLNPGDSGICKIELINNAGYDWHMLKEGMISPSIDQSHLAAEDRLDKVALRVYDPSEYRFMRIEAEDPELRPYVSVVPWRKTKYMVPEFFDFENINVPTVRDGYKSTFYVNITLARDTPPQFHGRVHKLLIELDHAYFDHMPGRPNDLIEHDYVLEPPPIYMGIPYQANSALPPGYSSWRGLVFTTYGYSTRLRLTERVPAELRVDAARLITAGELQELRRRSSTIEDRTAQLRNYFDKSVRGNFVNVTVVGEEEEEGGLRTVWIDTDAEMPRFPIPQPVMPDLAEFYVCIRWKAPYLPFGDQLVARGLAVDFGNLVNESKQVATNPTEYSIPTKGAFMESTTTYTLVSEQAPHRPVLNQALSREGVNTLQVLFSTMNTGTDICYNVQLEVALGPGVEIHNDSLASVGHPYKYNATSGLFTVDMKDDIPPGDRSSIVLFLRQDPTVTTPAQARLFTAANELRWRPYRDGDVSPPARNAPGSVVFVQQMDMAFDLEDTVGSARAQQPLAGSHVRLYYEDYVAPNYTATLHLQQDDRRSRPAEGLAAVVLNATTNALDDLSTELVRFVFDRRVGLRPGDAGYTPQDKTLVLDRWVELCKGLSPICVDEAAPIDPRLLVLYRVSVMVQEDELMAARIGAQGAQLFSYRGPAMSGGSAAGLAVGLLLLVAIAVLAVLGVWKRKWVAALWKERLLPRLQVLLPNRQSKRAPPSKATAKVAVALTVVQNPALTEQSRKLPPHVASPTPTVTRPSPAPAAVPARVGAKKLPPLPPRPAPALPRL